MQEMIRGQAPLADYDAICTVVFGEYKDIARFMFDPASKALAPDHERFHGRIGDADADGR